MAKSYKMPDGQIEYQFDDDEKMLFYIVEKYCGTETKNLLCDVVDFYKTEINRLEEELEIYQIEEY